MAPWRAGGPPEFRSQLSLKKLVGNAGHYPSSRVSEILTQRDKAESDTPEHQTHACTHAHGQDLGWGGRCVDEL